MKELLLEMYVKSDLGNGVIEDTSDYRNRYDEVLKEADEEEPQPERSNQRGRLKRTKGRNLFERLKREKESVLLFSKIPEVPFTNNLAERDLRQVKVKQKVCGGFRAESGTESYSRIHSFISTMRKQSRQVFKELRSVIEGKPFQLSQT
jgi:transposase